jgi:glycyl-tRNA synthetase beta chain
LRLDNPELRVVIDRKRAADLNVDTEHIASALRLMVGGGTEVSRFIDPAINEEYDVDLRLSQQDREDIGTISRLYIPRAEVVPLTVDGITAANTTEGHRFMGKGRFSVASFDDYAAKLKQNRVILDPAARADAIWAEATNQAFANGLEVVEDAGLLAEVAGLVEWPVVLMGAIDAAFLGLPPEVLQTSMREHQKFFSVRNPKTGRIERFITVANIETRDNGATILAGNQKVLSARLSDARFFWENDLRTVKNVGLEGMAAGLSSVTFHNKLGSQADRVARIEAVAR